MPNPRQIIQVTLDDILHELESIKAMRPDDNYKQDRALHDYINYSYDLIQDLKSKNDNNMDILRGLIFHLNQFAKRIPSRPKPGFWSNLFNKYYRGNLFNEVCSLHNRIVNSDFYIKLNNIDEIIECAKITGLLDLSYCNLQENQLHKIFALTNIKQLKLSTTRVYKQDMKISMIKAGELGFVKFLLANANHLELLDLSGNDLATLAPDILKALKTNLPKFINLQSLILRNNKITDTVLSTLFEISVVKNAFSNVNNFIQLKFLDLSCNFIRFNNYHQVSPNRSEELFLSALSTREIGVNLYYNFIGVLCAEDKTYSPSPIFKNYPNILCDPSQAATTKVESIINPDYLIDYDTTLVVIADKIDIEHAQIFAEIIDENSQHYIMQYHLTEDRHRKNERSCGTVVSMKMYREGDYTNFLESKTDTFRFGKFYTVNKSKLSAMERAIKGDAEGGMEQTLCSLHFSCCDSAINCFRYCLYLIKEFIDANVTEPWVAIPRFYLNNIAPLTTDYGRFCLGVPVLPSRSLTLNTLTGDLGPIKEEIAFGAVANPYSGFERKETYRFASIIPPDSPMFGKEPTVWERLKIKIFNGLTAGRDFDAQKLSLIQAIIEKVLSNKHNSLNIYIQSLEDQDKLIDKIKLRVHNSDAFTKESNIEEVDILDGINNYILARKKGKDHASQPTRRNSR